MKYDIILWSADGSHSALDNLNYDKNNITVIASQADSFPAAINKAFPQGNNEYVLILKGNCVLAADALSEMDKYIACAAAEVVAFELRHIPCEQEKHVNPITLYTDRCDMSAVVLKRQAFEKAGGFDTTFNCLYHIDLSWRLRAEGGLLQYCPLSAVSVPVEKDEKFLYEYGEYEKLLLAFKYTDSTFAKKMRADFVNTIKNPRHFPNVRKDLLKLYAKHFMQTGKLSAFYLKNKEKVSQIADFQPGFTAQRGQSIVANYSERPLVSVVIRTHKRKAVLRETLKTLRNQIYKNFEVVIVEDGENTAQQMVEQEFTDLNINYYSTGKNVGRGRAGNIGVEISKGELVCFLDDDDFFYPDFIYTFVSKFVEKPETDVAIAGIMAFENTVYSTEPYEYKIEKMYPVNFDHITLMDMCVKCRVPMTGGMFRRELYEQYGGMHEQIDGDEDWYMWLKYITKGKRATPYNADINRALSMFGYPADPVVAQKRLDAYEIYDKEMLYNESLVFDVSGEEIQKWEEFVQADINHLRNIGQLENFMANLKPLDVEKLDYKANETNTITAKQINNYYYWLVQEYAKQ